MAMHNQPLKSFIQNQVPKPLFIFIEYVNVLMPLNQQPKLQWSVPFPNGPETVSVMMKTTTPSADLMEVIVVITMARVGITTAASVSALKCQKPLNHPWKLLKNPGIPLKNQWRPLKVSSTPVTKRTKAPLI